MTKLSSADVPTSCLVPARSHPRAEEIGREVDGYFLEHWPFPNEKARLKFLGAGFSRVTCMYFPLALDDRIHFACRLLTLLFLIDEHMSLAAGAEYNERLMRISRGALPDNSIPAESITYELWESMRAHDLDMANDILEPVFVFMRAQTDSTRLKPLDMRAYLEYRERDVGKALLGSLMRFSMGLHVSAAELSAAAPADMTCSKHLSVVNDIWSYEKELKASKTAHEEGGVLCTSVAILARDASLSIPAAKRVLYSMCREWELQYKENERAVLEVRDTPALRTYLLGLELQMTGNELWSRTTERYLS
ncbi:aristolochene synthase [Diaporthe eres]|nr:aristolochene synthase [Diaporthe eres]